MSASIIHCKLDLLVRLIDTTTGAVVEERNVQFVKDGKAVRPVPRGSGNYVFVNCGRKDGLLEVKAQGYELCRDMLSYQNLDSNLPVKEMFLIPSENMAKGQPVITLSGKLPGLETLQAVNLSSTCCCISEFDERKRIMKLFKKQRFDMDDLYYALVNMEGQTYEPFTVVKEISENSVKISQPLKQPFLVNAPIARIVFGMVTPEGNYCIRVRDDSQRLIYLIRYVAKGKEKFKMADFHNLEGTAL